MLKNVLLSIARINYLHYKPSKLTEAEREELVWLSISTYYAVYTVAGEWLADKLVPTMK